MFKELSRLGLPVVVERWCDNQLVFLGDEPIRWVGLITQEWVSRKPALEPDEEKVRKDGV
jgi:hypothetical protein